MKTRIFTTILLFCFAVTGILADNLPAKVYVNEAKTPSGLIKEFVEVNSETLDPLQKTVYMYGKCGKIQKKSVISGMRRNGAELTSMNTSTIANKSRRRM